MTCPNYFIHLSDYGFYLAWSEKKKYQKQKMKKLKKKSLTVVIYMKIFINTARKNKKKWEQVNKNAWKYQKFRKITTNIL